MAGNQRNVLHEPRLAVRMTGSPAGKQGMAQLQHLGTDRKKNLLLVWKVSVIVHYYNTAASNSAT